ncbi:hypothetical protein NDU88_005644 [Pleurodeles waltl]|uniref:Uncharacterized protein n=1 Tax=Pleurodeles waltl TaxID=8319 RepID=A0AAV7WCI2_PLEWA|nr:hypothetical protein NDU88_005644 [Pleurodeles waltl]
MAGLEGKRPTRVTEERRGYNPEAIEEKAEETADQREGCHLDPLSQHILGRTWFSREKLEERQSRNPKLDGSVEREETWT